MKIAFDLIDKLWPGIVEFSEKNNMTFEEAINFYIAAGQEWKKAADKRKEELNKLLSIKKEEKKNDLVN